MSPAATTLNGDTQDVGGDYVKQIANGEKTAPIGEPASGSKAGDLLPQLEELFSDNVVMKIWKTATDHLERKVCRPPPYRRNA